MAYVNLRLLNGINVFLNCLLSFVGMIANGVTVAVVCMSDYYLKKNEVARQRRNVELTLPVCLREKMSAHQSGHQNAHPGTLSTYNVRRRNQPKPLTKISCKLYLIAFSITNVIGLLVKMYSETLNRQIYAFGIVINVQKANTHPLWPSTADVSYIELKESANNLLVEMNLVNANAFVCKLTRFIDISNVVCNSLILVVYSIERFLVVYKPMKMMNFRDKLSSYSSVKVIKILVIVLLSCALAWSVIHGATLKQRASDMSNWHVAFNRSNTEIVLETNAELHTITPSYLEKTCRNRNDTTSLHVSHLTLLFFIVISFLFIFISILLVVKKLESEQKKFENKPTEFPMAKLTIEPVKSKKQSDNESNEDNESLTQPNKLLEQTTPFIVAKQCGPSTSTKKNEENSMSINTISTSLSRMRSTQPKSRKHLLLLPIAFMILICNVPYYVSQMYYVFNEHILEDFVLDDQMFASIYLILDTLQTFYFSLSSLLLLLVSETFRVYLKRLFTFGKKN